MEVPEAVKEELLLPDGGFRQFGRSSSEKRKGAVDQAILWESGINEEDQHPTQLYQFHEYDVIMGKPGKEAGPHYVQCRFKTGEMGRNKNDMTPKLLVNGEPHPNGFSFEDIFRLLTRIYASDRDVLELVGTILCRNAFMLDHTRGPDGIWRLQLPMHTLQLIGTKLEAIETIPIPVFLYMADAISLNEDVKYHTLGYNDNLGNATGRRNNLLTYCNLCGVFLRAVEFYKFASSFARRPIGISAINEGNAKVAFPLLWPE